MTDHAPEAMTRPDRPSTLTAPRRSTPLTLNFPSRVARLGAPMQQSARDDSGEGAYRCRVMLAARMSAHIFACC